MGTPTQEQRTELEKALLEGYQQTEPIPTEREWFNLFTDIAASLKVQADFVRQD